MTPRLLPGKLVALVNWSAGGALVDALSRIEPDGPLSLVLENSRGRVIAQGRVVRASVTALGGHGVVYRGAIRFERGLDIRHLTEPDGERSARGVGRGR